MIKPGVRKTA